MKYLCDHERAQKALELRAGQDELVTASFFFWNAGTVMQKSQEGLLQSLLYQILRKCPLLAPIVCPFRWQAADLHRDNSEPWTRSELSEALDRLMR